MERKQIYKIIKEKNLSSEISKAFGRNFTQISTLNLIDFICSQDNNEYSIDYVKKVFKELDDARKQKNKKR